MAAGKMLFYRCPLGYDLTPGVSQFVGYPGGWGRGGGVEIKKCNGGL